jgi:hypothetical protein
VGTVTGFAVAGICDPREKFTIVILAGSKSMDELPTKNILKALITFAEAENVEEPNNARASVSNSPALAVITEPPTIVLAPW